MAQRPNIIFIVADDLGFADLGCYGGRDATFGKVSPVLDGLAANGIRFSQGYSNSPVCSPTRFALMTARYQYRLRGALEEPINSKSKGSATLGLPPEMPTLPSLLKASGYRTALIGNPSLGHKGLVTRVEAVEQLAERHDRKLLVWGGIVSAGIVAAQFLQEKILGK